MDRLLRLLGRILYGLPFLGFGAGHLINADKMSVMVPAYIPGGVVWIYLTGVAFIVASVAIVTGIKARAACFGLALMLLVFVATIDLPGMANPNVQLQMMSTVGLLKDVSLVGAALVLASTFVPAAKK
jgi:uncharacterized membrane protein YphA (DoxX/SURF4 family)